MSEVLVLYYSRQGHTARLADHICRGVDSVPGTSARLRSVADEHNAYPAPEVQHDDLTQCQAIIIGSPCYFGGMPAALKAFWDSTTSLWLKGALVDRPAAVFSTSDSLHGGQESTLLTLALPLLHHGALLVGLPFSEPGLHRAEGGGSPYGASIHAHGQGDRPLSPDDSALAQALGRRVARIAQRMAK